MKAVDIYTDIGLFTEAAKHHRTIAEIYEEEEKGDKRRSRSRSPPSRGGNRQAQTSMRNSDSIPFE